jgi:ATP-dependent DNA helicase
MAEMAADLLRLEGEKIDVVPDVEEDSDDDDNSGNKRRRRARFRERVLSDRHLDMLLDRSPEVFESRGLGWTSDTFQKAEEDTNGEATRKAAFAVYEAPKDQGNDALTAMIDEDD